MDDIEERKLQASVQLQCLPNLRKAIHNSFSYSFVFLINQDCYKKVYKSSNNGTFYPQILNITNVSKYLLSATKKNKRIKGRTGVCAPTATDNSNVWGRPMCLPKMKYPPKKTTSAVLLAQPRYVIYKDLSLLFSDELFTILNVDTTLNGLCYLAALEVVDCTIAVCNAIGCDRVDACYATGYGDPACVVGKFLF